MTAIRKATLFASIGLAGLACVLAYRHMRAVTDLAETLALLRAARSLHLALFDRGMADVEQSRMQQHFARASSAAYENSTDYFTTMVTSGFLNVNFAFFAGKGVPPSESTNPAHFRAQNNAWCIVADIDSIADGNTPIIFTRNVALTTMGPGSQPTISGNMPFGTSRWIYVTKSGNAFIAEGHTLPQWHMGLTTNKVLRP